MFKSSSNIEMVPAFYLFDLVQPLNQSEASIAMKYHPVTYIRRYKYPTPSPADRPLPINQDNLLKKRRRRSKLINPLLLGLMASFGTLTSGCGNTDIIN